MNITVAHFGTHYVDMPGGVEKLTCYLSSDLVKKGYDITVLYRDGKEGMPYFPIDPKVKQFNILFEKGHKIVFEKLPLLLRVYREFIRIFSQKKAQGVNAEFKGRQYGPRIRHFLNQYPADVILSCSAPSTKYVITDGEYKGPVITMFRGDPAVQMPLLSWEERAAVAKSAAIQVLWPSKIDIAKKYFPNIPVVAIGNAIFPAVVQAQPGKLKKRYLISCVGNISGRKNQKLLMHAFASIAKQYSDWYLEFWGEKSSLYAQSMEKEIKKKHLEDRIFLKGKTNHIEEVYSRSDIFCIPSKSEGFPQGLAEAMSSGLPCIGLKKCGGTNELIQDGITGYLVDDDANALANRLEDLINNGAKRQSMGKESRKIVSQYEPSKMWALWEKLIHDVC